MKFLMVCLGNICRSPLAEGILKEKAGSKGLDWTVESAGTSGWHVGEPPDRRSIEVAFTNDIDISKQRSRQLTKSDFKNFDAIISMDESVHRDVVALGDKEVKCRLINVKSFMQESKWDHIPDPYYNGGFQMVFDLLNDVCDKIIDEYKEQ